MITVCIPTLNRYDLLHKLIDSAERGTVVPDRYLIIDNGGKLEFFGVPSGGKVDLHVPPRNMGVAASWNWLIRNSQEIRIVCNDDLEFDSDLVESIVTHYDEKKLIYPEKTSLLNIYSFFVISDYVFNLVGEFDESISPNYAYYEDNDYDWRLKEIRSRLGNDIIDYSAIPSGYTHLGSGTIAKMSNIELQEHHRKFKIAKNNFLRKWGRLPNDN